MFGLKKEKRDEIIGIGYSAGDLVHKSKEALKSGDESEMLKRILRNQIFLLKVISEQFTDLE